MARPGKGARLYLRAGRVDRRTGRKVAAVYFIRDGQTNISTGCGPERLAEAEVALAEYMAAKRVAVSATKRSADDPEDVLVADVVGLYAKEKGPLSADPKALAVRLATILEWWGDKSLGDIRRSSCMAYVAHRVSQPIRSYKIGDAAPRVSEAGARRELEDLSAAVTWWAKEHAQTRKPEFTYPVKPEGARDALSRSEAAALLWAATWLMEADVPAHRAAQYLGMTVKTLEKYYGYHRADFQNDVTEAISRGGRGKDVRNANS